MKYLSPPLPVHWTTHSLFHSYTVSLFSPKIFTAYTTHSCSTLVWNTKILVTYYIHTTLSETISTNTTDFPKKGQHPVYMIQLYTSSRLLSKQISFHSISFFLLLIYFSVTLYSSLISMTCSARDVHFLLDYLLISSFHPILYFFFFLSLNPYTSLTVFDSIFSSFKPNFLAFHFIYFGIKV